MYAEAIRSKNNMAVVTLSQKISTQMLLITESANRSKSVSRNPLFLYGRNV